MKSYLVAAVCLLVAGTMGAQEKEARELEPGRYVWIGSNDERVGGGLVFDPVIVDITKDGDDLVMTAEDKQYVFGKVTREEGKYVFTVRYRELIGMIEKETWLLMCAGTYLPSDTTRFQGGFGLINLRGLGTNTGTFTLFPVDARK